MFVNNAKIITHIEPSVGDCLKVILVKAINRQTAKSNKYAL